MIASGKIAKANGKAMKATGRAMSASGKAVEAAGKGIEAGAKAAGEALAATGIGAPVGVAITGAGTAAGKGMQGAGKGLDSAGKATKKAGEATEKAGKKAEETGKNIINSGSKNKGGIVKNVINKKKNSKNKGIKKAIRSFIIANIVPISIIILILVLIFFVVAVALFLISAPSMMLGKIDDWGREILGNIQGIFTGDSTTAKISAEEVLGLAEYLEKMNYSIEGYGLGTVKYKDDGKTSFEKNGKSREIEEITKNVEGKEYLRSYIAANENTYVLSQYSIMGAFTSEIHNLQEIFEFDKDKDFTSANDYSTGMIDIVGNQGDLFKTSNSAFAEINRDTKQLKIYSEAIQLGPIGTIKQVFTGNPNIQWGEAFSYDLNSWVGRYGRPTELFLALHLSTLMPDLTYEIATAQDFNTKVKIGLMDTKVIYNVTATKEGETINSDQIKDYANKYVSGEGSDATIPGTPWTTKEIAELEEVRRRGEGKLSNITPDGVTDISPTGMGGSGGIDAVTDTSMSKTVFLQKVNEYAAKQGGHRDFVDNADVIYDVCIKNGINPVLCASQGYTEQGWISPSGAQYNYWGLGIYNGMSTSVLGPIGSPEEYAQKYCDNINTRLNGGVGVIEESQRLTQYDSVHYTGGVNTIYDVFCNYAAPDNDNSAKGQADYMTDYIDNHLTVCAENIFGEGALDGSGIKIKWPFIAQIKNHWFYKDIDFTKDVYRFAKAAEKQIDYKPEDEEDVLNKNNVSVRLDATLSSKQGIIYQVAEPEATGPNDKIKELFSKEYYQYDTNPFTSELIENAKAIQAGKSKYRFDGEEKFVDLSLGEKVKKKKVEFREDKSDVLQAFAMLENMHTEASDYIFRNLKELVIDLKYFTTAELTEDLQNILLWPVKTKNQNINWDTQTESTTTSDEKKFGTIILCEEDEKEVISPSSAKVAEIKGNEITLEFTELDDETYELLTYIYQSKDPYKKINRELPTGMRCIIKDVQLEGISVGQKVARGQKLGTAVGNTKNKSSILIQLEEVDGSFVEDINKYLRPENNSKYEEVMKLKKEAPAKYKEGLDITAVLTGGKAGSRWAGSENAPQNVKEFVDRALMTEGSGYSWTGYNWTGDISSSWFTCSGLVDFALGNPPRTNNPESFYAAVSEMGNLTMNTSELKYGDLVFYQYAGRYPGHVAIYIGDGKEIEADGSSVAIHDVGWMPFIGGGTYLK